MKLLVISGVNKKGEKMKSNLHQKLQYKGREYLLNKGYWVRAMEMSTSVGIIDVWGISNANNFETIAIEVKVSRNDYKSRSQKYKEFSARNIANYCYVLCPEFMVDKVNDSPKWGILWYSEKSDRLRLVREPERFEMTDRQKLAIVVHFFENRANNPDNLLDIKIKK